MIIIDGTNLIVGRVATVAAKSALNGEDVKIINCEKMYITGNRSSLLADGHRKRVQGTWSKGPFFFRQPDRLVRRVVRGMLPHTTSRGTNAFKRVLCYIGSPENLKDHKPITIANANISKIQNLKYITVEELSKQLGAKI